MVKDSKTPRPTPKEMVLVVVLTLISFPSTLSVLYLGAMVWDRQHSVVFLDRTTVFDRWDLFGAPKPEPVGNVDKGAKLRVLHVFHSIEGGGIRIRLPNGRLAHLVAFGSEPNYVLKRSLEPISLLILVAFVVVLGWVWLFAIGKKLTKRLLVVAILFPASLMVNFLMLRGIL